MTGPPGYGSAEQYAREIEREANRITGNERRYSSGTQRKQQQRVRVPQTQGAISGPMRGEGDYDAQGFKYAGKPGSPERMQQLRERYPEMYPQVNRELEAANLSKLLSAYMDNPGQHEQVALQTARMIVEIDDPGILDQVREVLEGTPVLERVEDHVATAVQNQIDRYEQETQEQRQAAIDARHEKLQSELDRLHPKDAQFVLDSIPAEELYELPEDEATLHMRTVAEVSASQRKALSGFALMSPIVEELKRYGASSMTDAERDKFERELEADAMRNFDKAMVEPEQAVDRAADSMIRESKPSSGMDVLDLKELGEELGKLSKTEAQIQEEIEMSKRVFPEKYSGEEKLPTRTSATEWES